METIVFAGAGSMTEAMIGGILVQGAIKPENVFIMNRSNKERLLSLKSKYGVSIVDDDKTALAEADLIILAMKPADIGSGLDGIAPYLRKETAILSLIAGVSIDTIEKGLGKRPVARAMANTSATVGKSASAVAWNETIDGRIKKIVFGLLKAIGMVEEVEESQLHTVTALSGSGPAYVYYLIEALEEAAVDSGLSQEVSRALLIQTVEGAAVMLKKTEMEPAVLRQKITSAGGTTEAAIESLENRSFKEIIAECFEKAVSRSRDLGSSN